MIKPWKFIARKHVFQHPRLQLAEDTVALPNGKEISYLREAPAKTHSVAIIAINADGHILLQKEYSYPPNTALWQLPGGAIESGESISKAYGQTAQKSHAWLRQVKLRISHCLQRCSYMTLTIIMLYNPL